jgi:hypothetical protein
MLTDYADVPCWPEGYAQGTTNGRAKGRQVVDEGIERFTHVKVMMPPSSIWSRKRRL